MIINCGKKCKYMGKNNIPVHRPKTQSEFRKLNNELSKRGFMAIDALRPGFVHSLTLGDKDPASGGASEMATVIGGGKWSNGPLVKVAWGFDSRDQDINSVSDQDGNVLGLGYVKWGPGNNIPSTIPVLASASPYTAAPLRYIADLTAGLGPCLMYRFDDGSMCEFKDAGPRLFAAWEAARKERVTEDDNPLLGSFDDDDPALHGGPMPGTEDETPSELRARRKYEDWLLTWEGEDVCDNPDAPKDLRTYTHIPGAKEFLEDNNLTLHLSQCEQDDVMLDIYFPTVGLQRGRSGAWDPRIVRVDMLPAHSVRLERMNEYRHINHVYFSDQWRTNGATGAAAASVDSNKVVMYPAAMPQHMLSDLRYIVDSHKRSRIKDRPTWVVCPTYYPSGQKPYYPQPAWWSIFTSKAFDFSSTILYDKAKARENKTSWGKIIYISLDYLEQVFADEGYQGNPEAQQQFIDDLESRMEEFLQHRENNGKMMRQWMWEGKDGKEHHNIEIVNVTETTKDAAAAGKDELELSTSPIFLALQVDPRLVGVPMVSASNGGTALREMHLLKQQQLNVKQRLYLQFLNNVCRFNRWDEHATFVIIQQTLTTLDNSKTGTVETVAGKEA